MFTSLPKIPLLLLAIGLSAGAYFLKPEMTESPKTKKTKTHDPPQDITIEKLLGNETLEMELGLDLIPLADPKTGGTLLPSVTNIRKRLATNLGVVLPKIRIKDNLQLPANEYRILVQGNPVDIGTVFPNFELATDKGKASGPILGAVATETTEDGQAFWIQSQNRVDAERLGYLTQTATQVLISRLTDVANQYAPELLTRDATHQLIEETRKTAPAIIEELIPAIISLKKLQQILRNLVSENVSIRPMGLILETIADSNNHQEIWPLVEAIRQRLGPQITARLLDDGHSIKAITVENELEASISSQFAIVRGQLQCNMKSETVAALKNAVSQGLENMENAGQQPIMCVSQELRPVVKMICDQFELKVSVL
ncbi:MAG: FHIPEP family type III secretion protein, partial [Planctomycetota bacterium]